jgi:hypothetical protein
MTAFTSSSGNLGALTPAGPAEREATYFQIGVGRKIGLSEEDTNRLKNYADHIEDYKKYWVFGTRQKFAVSELVSKPGHYKLLAEYHCPVDPKEGKVGNFWSIERKSVVSKEIEFNVK